MGTSDVCITHIYVVIIGEWIKALWFGTKSGSHSPLFGSIDSYDLVKVQAIDGCLEKVELYANDGHLNAIKFDGVAANDVLYEKGAEDAWNDIINPEHAFDDKQMVDIFTKMVNYWSYLIMKHETREIVQTI